MCASEEKAVVCVLMVQFCFYSSVWASLKSITMENPTAGNVKFFRRESGKVRAQIIRDGLSLISSLNVGLKGQLRNIFLILMDNTTDSFPEEYERSRLNLTIQHVFVLENTVFFSWFFIVSQNDIFDFLNIYI